jgi:ferrochelatase
MSRGMPASRSAPVEAERVCGPFDALVVVSFGGPEKPDDVAPFLENVLRGKPVSTERLQEIAGHYALFQGVSPLNAQNRALVAALVADLRVHRLSIPVYWGNRYWHPLLTDTLQQMADDGVRSALAFVTSAFGSHASCRQYLDAIEQSRLTVGANAPRVDKLRLFFNHPGFIDATADRVGAAMAQVPAERREKARLVFTAHSIPLAMAQASPYERQVREACRLVADSVGKSEWSLAYQSRSGPPQQTWLEPEVGDWLVHLRQSAGVRDVVLVPIGFLCEHMEVVYDLDIEIAALCQSLEINLVRSATVGTHPRFVGMIRELVMERLDPNAPRQSRGDLGPTPDVCPADCCIPRTPGR